MFYEVTVKFVKIDENGENKRVSEKYLLKDAVSFTDAEKQITEEFTPYSPEDFDVVAIKRSNIKECISEVNDGTKQIFIVKANLVTLDENSGKEKRTPCSFCTFADSIEDAKNKLVEFMRSTMPDYEVIEVKKTNYIDLIDR